MECMTRRLLAVLLLSCASASALAGSPTTPAVARDALLAGFRNPGEAARPRVWWHWMNGNITWDGAKKDMDWMKRVGIAGLQAFDAGQATLQVVDKRLPYMSDGWKEATKYGTLNEGPRLDRDLMFEDVFKEVPEHLRRQREQLHAEQG